MDTYVIDASGKLLEVTVDTITRPGERGSGRAQSAWTKRDVVNIAVYDEEKVSVGSILLSAALGLLSKRTDVTLTFALAGASWQTFTVKKAKAAEVAMALQLRGWPVNGSGSS